MLDKALPPPSNTGQKASPAPIEEPPVAGDVPRPETPLEFFITDTLEIAPNPLEAPDATGKLPTDEIPHIPTIPLTSLASNADDTEHEQVLASTLIMPRATSEIPGYSKWTEGAFNTATSFNDTKATQWPFTLVAFLLGIALVGQLIFYFRMDIAVAAPYLRPPLAALSEVFRTNIPLPRHVALISIETSDLQVDPRNAALLALQATLRNRATHAQAYPALQLSLTDTQDSVILRRVFLPEEYLSPQNLTPLVFAANSEISVRLWIEAKDITAAGYRLYAFYP
jgi:hypothetical protein